MNTIVERVYGGEFMLSDANGEYTREGLMIGASQTLLSGSIVGKVTKGAVTVAAAAVVGAGNGVLTLADPAYAAGVQEGEWRVVCVEEAADSGGFEIRDPDGKVVAGLAVGGAYDGAIKIVSLTAGATAWVVGDYVPITVSYAAVTAADQVCKALDPAAHDGTETFYAILWDGRTTEAGETTPAAGVVRGPCEVIAARLDFGTLTDEQIAAVKLQIAAKGIVIR